MPGGFPGGGWGTCSGTDVGTDTANSRGTALTAPRGSYGSYVQLVASTASDASWCELSFHCGSINNTGGAIRLAVGGAGSEKVILTDLVICTSGSGFSESRISFPVCIPAGTRVAAGAQCFSAGGETAYYVNAQLFDGGFPSEEGIAGYDSIGFDTANAYGTVLTASATANTKGTYVQLVASTARDYCGLFIMADTNANGSFSVTTLVDIAIGASGSELVIIPNWHSGLLQDNVTSGFAPVAIPAGTRIAARCQASTGSSKIDISLQGAYQ